MEFAYLMKLICFMVSVNRVELIFGQLYSTLPPSKLDEFIGRDSWEKLLVQGNKLTPGDKAIGVKKVVLMVISEACHTLMGVTNLILEGDDAL